MESDEELTRTLQLRQNLSSFKLVADHLQVGFDAADEAGALQEEEEEQEEEEGEEEEEEEEEENGAETEVRTPT